ncbi:MAG: penicillin-binding transpeptidase domain-containing protein [Bacillota bacterium]|nr:penicillin-binding transpeptidase domain-containing protein [Bacillota bacterium]
MAEGGERYRREYRGPAGLAATIGYLSPRYGASGLEAAYDALLRGTTVESWAARLLAAGRGGRAGGLPDLRTTFRLRVQQAAEQAMDGRRGAVVALDPRTGEVLALVSLPGFAPDRVDRDWETLRQRPDSPLLNRALAGLYPPGSAFKPAVALAALEAGETRPGEPFVCPGRRTVRGQTIADLGSVAHGPLDLSRAMVVSCNYVFSGLAMRLDPAWLAQQTGRFGLLAPAGLGLPERAGHFPDPARLEPADLAELGIGQGSLLLTPFALARFVAMLANGGRLVEPRLVRGVGLPGAGMVALGAGRAPRPRRVADPESVAAVNRMLERVVAEGTGGRARLAGVKVAGKTGSAENPHGAPHAWFIGFAPADAPVVAVAVVVENGGLGGEVAAPVAREVIAAALGR